MAPSERRGLFAHGAALIGANIAYLRARLQLAGLEGKDAAVHYAIILGLAVAALVMLVFAYLFLVIAVVFLIAWLCGGGNAWIWVTFAVAAVHGVIALVLVAIARNRLSQPVFEATLTEFKKDQEWLKNLAKPN